MRCYNPKIELVNDIVYTKSGLNMSIHSEDMEKNPKVMPIKCRNPVPNLQKMIALQSQHRYCQ